MSNKKQFAVVVLDSNDNEFRYDANWDGMDMDFSEAHDVVLPYDDTEMLQSVVPLVTTELNIIDDFDEIYVSYNTRTKTPTFGI